MSFSSYLETDFIIDNIIYFHFMHTTKESSCKLLVKQATNCAKCLLKLPQGFILSVVSPRLRFLASIPKSECRQLIFFHWEESVRWQSIPSQFLPSTCHVRSFASSPLANRRLNIGMIERYHNTFVGGLSLCFCHCYIHHHPSLYTVIPDTWGIYPFLHTHVYTVCNH